jgi:sulfate adenylyltransferase
MTAQPESADAAALETLPRVVLDADGLDRLELVLGGWLPSSAIEGLAGPGGAMLTDAENTPLARIRVAPGGAPVAEPLAELARGGGPHWDPSVRLSAAALRERLGAVDGGGAIGAVAVVVDEPPARTDVDRLVASATRAGVSRLVVVVPVERRQRPSGEVGWSGLTRAAWAAADAVAEAAPDRTVVRLAIPWPPDAAPDLSAGGVGPVARIGEGRTDAEAATIAAADRVSGADLDALYPPASARELRAATGSGGTAGPGAVVFFTGLSGSGKSTIARALADELADDGPRRVTLLDGDEVRQHLSRGLGFDAESREINVDRIAWVAALVAAHGGIAVAAPIAPFDAGRRNARALAAGHGAFLLVWIDTPLAVCEARDRKGLYARARAGEVAEFTGISSPYEPPGDAEVVIDTTQVDVAEAVRRIRGALDAKLAAT